MYMIALYFLYFLLLFATVFMFACAAKLVHLDGCLTMDFKIYKDTVLVYYLKLLYCCPEYSNLMKPMSWNLKTRQILQWT